MAAYRRAAERAGDFDEVTPDQFSGPVPSRSWHTSVPIKIVAFLLILAALWSAQTLLIPLVFAGLAACGLEPLHRRLVTWGLRRGFSAGLLLIAVVALLAGAGWGLRVQASTFATQLPTLTARVRSALRDGGGPFSNAVQPVQQAANELKKAADESGPPPAKGVTRVQVEQPPMRLTDWLWRGTMSALELVIQVTMVLLLVYYLLASGERYKEKILKIVGPSAAREHVTLDILNRITEQIERFLVARVIISAIVATATTGSLFALHMSQALMWGLVAGLLNNIPYLGSITSVVAIAMAAFVQFGTIEMAGAAAGAAALVAAVEGMFLTPWIMGRAGRMNTGVVFISLMFWGWIWGVWGMLFAVPIMMAIKAVCDHIDAFRPVSEVLSE